MGSGYREGVAREDVEGGRTGLSHSSLCPQSPWGGGNLATPVLGGWPFCGRTINRPCVHVGHQSQLKLEAECIPCLLPGG